MMIGHNCHNSFTDRAYEKIYLLEQLRYLDLCGAQVFIDIIMMIMIFIILLLIKRIFFQNLSDSALNQIARCKNLVSLNLTWLVS